MKAMTGQVLAAAFAVVLGMILIPATDLLLYVKGVLPIRPTLVFAATIALLPLSWLLRGGLGLHPSLNAAVIRRNAPVLGSLFFLVLLMLGGVLLPHSNLQGGGTLVFLAAFHAVAAVLLLLSTAEPVVRRWLPTGLTLGLLLVLGSLALDFIRPTHPHELRGRAAGVAMNPNAAAFLLVILTSAILDFRRFRRRDLFIFLLALIGVFATFSRGGFVLLILLLLVYFAAHSWQGRGDRRTHLKLMGTVAILVAVFLLAAQLVQVTAGAFAGSAVVRVLQLLSGDVTALLGDATRSGLVTEYLDKARQRPLLGFGTGYTFTQPLGPHNIYLRLWVENGILGFLSYTATIGFAGLLFLHRRFFNGFAFILVLGAFGFLSHNILEMRPPMLLFGILLGLSVAAPQDWPIKNHAGAASGRAPESNY